MIAYMRNRRTTEHRAVQLDGEEFLAMREEIGPDNRPVWEQTSSAEAIQQQTRIREGAPRPEDYGDDDQPQAVIDGRGVPIEVRDRRIDPTDGEREMGITPEDKLAEIEAAESGQFGTGASVIGDGTHVSSGQETRSVEEVGEGTIGSGSGDDALTKEELQDEARERGLPVSGTKAELRSRIEEHDNAGEEEERA